MTLLVSNAVVPTLLFAWPAMAVWVLVFAVVVEALCYKYLLGVQFDSALSASARANAVSTLVGIPIAGIVLLVVIFILANTINIEESYIGRFLIPMAFLSDIPERFQLASAMGLVTLLLVFLIVSVRIESGYIESIVDEEQTNVVRAVWIAHAVTYAPVIALVLYSIL